jgi:acyl-CoA dehydrogenase
MDFDLTERQAFYRDRVRDFVETHIRPRTGDYKAQLNAGDRWQPVGVIEELKPKAKAAGLWNLFMPPGPCAPACRRELRVRGHAAHQPRICALRRGDGQDRLGVGGLQLLGARHRQYGSVPPLRHAPQKERWLKPLMNGEIRSAFLMTEPGVASSDATNIQLEIRRDGDEYVLNGRKWWSSGAGDPRCKVAIVMGKTDTAARKHQQQSMVLVPLDAPGVTVERRSPSTAMTMRRTATWKSSSRTSASPPPTCCSAKAAASRSLKGGWGRAVSTIACAPSVPPRRRWRRW